MVEEWRDVVGYEGYYQVSNFGNIRSIDRYVFTPIGDNKRIQKGKVIKPCYARRGYLLVRLCKEGQGKMLSVHRLVARAFLGDSHGLTVNHIDKIKDNNHVGNLEYMTNQENIEYSSAKVYWFLSPDGVKTKVFNLSKYCRDNDLKQAHMWAVSVGKRPHHKGWRKSEEDEEE